MNFIPAKITEIKSVESVTIVAFDSSNLTMKMMALDMNEPLEVGSSVVLGVKASHISLAKRVQEDVSISNQLLTSIDSLRKGELLCSVKLRFHDSILESIITMESALKMNLLVGDKVIALIKSSDLFIKRLD